jgi:hypothetical protein
MKSFPTWAEWVAFRESNARKRAVRSALNGTGSPLPGSYAACPSTNPQAMNVAKKKGVVSKAGIFENEGQKPDYSFDRWVQKAKEFGDDVNKMAHSAEDEEEKLEKESDKTDKAAPHGEPEDKEDPPEPASNKKEETWKALRKIHQDRRKDAESQSGSGKTAAGSSARPAKRSSSS